MKSEADILRMHALFSEGWSKRRIAAELSISRNTLDRYLHSFSESSRKSKIPKGKLMICLEWLALQGLSGRESCKVLQEKLEAERNVHVSQRTIERALKRLHGSADTTWRIGPYHLRASGELSLGDALIEMPQAQRQLLLMFVKNPNQVVSREEIAQQLWPSRKLSANQLSNVSLCMHRLRQVFAMGPLGGNVIKSVYRKGYVLHAAVEQCPPTSLPKQPASDLNDIEMIDDPFYGEAHDSWANRDPYKLSRQEWLLQKCVQHNPTFERGYLELCYFQILQCFWGMRASQAVLPNLQQLLETIDQFTPQHTGWLGIKAEVQSLLLWQPQTSQRLYGGWLADSLPRGMPLMAWARHLIFTGRANTAIHLLKAHVNDELCQGWLVLAMAYCALGDMRAAEEAIQRQLKLDSTMVGTRLLLALLMAQRGESALATQHVLDSGILDRPFQGVQALAAYTLAQGPLHQRAQHLLDEAMERMHQSPSQSGALGYWGLAALELKREVEAIQCLKLSVRNRCYSAPVLFSTPFLKPYTHTIAYRLFAEKMRRFFPMLA